LDIIPGYAGTYRIVFDLRTSNASATAYARIYDVTASEYIGTERSTVSTDYVTYSEDIAVTAGHEIKLKAKTSDSDHFISVDNFQFKTAEPIAFSY